MIISSDEAITIAQNYLLEIHHIKLPLVYAMFAAADRNDPAYTFDTWSVYFDPAPIEGYTEVIVNAQTGAIHRKSYSNIEEEKQNFLYLAYLKASVACPSCGWILYEELPFQWGLCYIHRLDGPAEQLKQIYVLGGQIHWHDKTSELKPMKVSSFEESEANIGDAELKNLLLLNFEVYSFGPCPRCRYAEGAAAITIKAGRIAEVTLYKPKMYDEANSVYAINDDGSFISG